MKKFLILALVVLLLLGTFGCNNTTTSSGDNSVTVTSPNVETKITNLEKLQKGSVTYKKVPLNIYGGKISTFTLSYENPKRMYVALEGGEIYKTEDLGKTWQKIAKIVIPITDPCEPCYNSFSINSITESDNGRVLYVLTSEGIFKSEDFGKTFMEIGNTFPLTFFPNSIIIPKENLNLIIVTGANGGTDFNAIFRSSDGGSTWKAIKKNFSSIIYNYATNELFATDTHSLFRSTDFGISWEKLEGTFDYIDSISISQSNPTVIVVKAQNDASYLSKDSGKHFEKLTMSFPILSKFCMNPKDTNFIIALPQYAKTFNQAKLFVSKDGGASFNDFQIFNVISDAKFSFDGSKLFILTDGGVLYSWDGKSTFKLENVFPEVDFEDIAVYSNEGLICTNAASFEVDFASGDITVLNKDGLDSLVHVAISEKNPMVAYASSYARLFALEGLNLKPVKDIEFAQGLLISPNDSSVLFVKISEGGDGRILTYVSYDHGKTLQSLSYPQKPYEIASLTFDPQNPSIMYAVGKESDSGNIALYKSEDNAKSFTKIPESFITNSLVDILSISMFDSSIYVYGESSGIFKSDDFGKTFKTFNKGISKIPNIGVVALEFNPKTKDLFLLTRSHGLFMCKNGSDTWVDISGNLPKEKISAIAVDKETGRVFIGVDGMGIFEVIP
jgi:photosystem II stability/assembly factor-like uncharacterized protein